MTHDELDYLRLAKGLLKEATEYDRTDIYDSADNPGLRTELLQIWLEKHLHRKLPPETMEALNEATHLSRQCDEAKLARVLEQLLNNG